MKDSVATGFKWTCKQPSVLRGDDEPMRGIR
jgi:hypothetical protein